jgi:HAD superfamily hydrolase (TIGR01549 family)
MYNKRLLICDLDNTLYDWVYFVPSFYAMVDTAVQITGCDRETLLDDFRRVHQVLGDSEQPFALFETETIKKMYPDVPSPSVAKILDPAFHAFNSSRLRNMRLYPTVRETLDVLASSDVRLIAHTESKLYGVVDRLKRLELFRYFSRVYCRERSSSLHPHPKVGIRWLDQFPMEKIVELSHHQRKPSPDVLLEICATEGIDLDDVAYIGDSIARDVLMARKANVFAVWAAYGSKHDPAMYKALVRVSHWTEAEETRERQLMEQAIDFPPDYTAELFSDIIGVFGIHPAISSNMVNSQSG